MAYSLWELLKFSPAELLERERALTWTEREKERLEALRQYENPVTRRATKLKPLE